MLSLLAKKRLRIQLEKNVRVIAIGDIHGQYARLHEVMSMIESFRARNPAKDEHIVFLGDYTDRGGQSAEVIDYLNHRRRAAKGAHHHEIFLKGNHEELMMDVCMGDGAKADLWWRNGGKQTVESYARLSGFNIRKKDTPLEAMQKFRDSFPGSHLKFLKKLKSMYQVGPLVFVHAGLRMEKPLADQREEDLFWIRGPFLNWQGASKKYLVVHGHSITPNFKPEIQSHRIGIDTGSYRKEGSITAAVFERKSVRFFSSGTLEHFIEGPFS